MADIEDTTSDSIDDDEYNAEDYLCYITAYDKEFEKWERSVDRIIRRYKDDGRDGNRGYQEAKFNILWSNVQTLTAATFAQTPKPDVSRRFKDQDQIGRVAALILERALEYEVGKYSDFSSTIKSSILDRFLGGRGTAWVRYEPHFKAASQSIPIDGLQITEDSDEAQEELDYECAPCDYVHWRDFGHSVGRTWEEVTCVWRRVFLSEDQCIERFGEEIGKEIPLDSIPDDSRERYSTNETEDDRSKACIYEIWDRENKKAIWITKSTKEIIDIKDDPLGLDNFFPCPRPLFATITNESLVPIPDFMFYLDQANELDIICDRIDGLVKALKVMGVYDASVTELQRLFTEADNNTLIPVEDWTVFSQKQGLQGSIDIIDLAPIGGALAQAYQAFEHVKNQIYEITGISDLIRGQTAASETATAQQLKGQYATLRLKTYQEEVARYASELLQIKAQIICGKFSPQTIMAISATEQLNPWDQQLIGPAMELLIGKDRMMFPEAPGTQNPMRAFRVEVSTDTMVYLDESQEKQSRVEFLTAVGGFIEKAMQAGAQSPQMIPILMEMLKFGIGGFKVGKTMEGLFDEVSMQLKQQAMQPKPPDPKQQAAQMQAQATAQKTQVDMQKNQMSLAVSQQKTQAANISANAEQIKAQADIIKSKNELNKANIELLKPRPLLPYSQ